jgi:hypothetical protein
MWRATPVLGRGWTVALQLTRTAARLGRPIESPLISPPCGAPHGYATLCQDFRPSPQQISRAKKKEITSCHGVDTCALSEASHARCPPQRNPWSLAYPSMTRSRNARVGRLYGLGRRRAARSPHAPVGEDLHEQPFPVWRSSSWPASKINQCSLARHSRDQLRNVERMVMRPCPAAQKPSAVKRRAKRPSECAIVWH